MCQRVHCGIGIYVICVVAFLCKFRFLYLVKKKKLTARNRIRDTILVTTPYVWRVTSRRVFQGPPFIFQTATRPTPVRHFPLANCSGQRTCEPTCYMRLITHSKFSPPYRSTVTHLHCLLNFVNFHLTFPSQNSCHFPFLFMVWMEI